MPASKHIAALLVAAALITMSVGCETVRFGLSVEHDGTTISEPAMATAKPWWKRSKTAPASAATSSDRYVPVDQETLWRAIRR